VSEPADRGDEHRETASRAGLRYVSDGFAGIRRRRVGRGWAFYAPDGTRITDPAERRRILGLAIPPAWTDVWICPDPAGHVQATARDARGRKQYRYHPAYREARDRSKFRRILEFSEILPSIRERVERDLRAPDLSRRQILATVVCLLDKTLIRVGNDEYARHNRSFGLTTLRGRHVAVEGERLRFAFRGKSGVQHSVAVTDRRLARIVQQCQDLPGQELFQYLDGTGRRQVISSGDVNAYLRHLSGRNITAKDFRTWAGTMLAARELRALGPAPSRREAERRVVRALDLVAERLGNTRAVCRKYYVHPAVLEAYLRGRTIGPVAEPPARRARATAALRRDEVAVLQFLQRETRAEDDSSLSRAPGPGSAQDRNATRQFRRMPARPGRVSAVSPNRRSNSASDSSSKKDGPACSRSPRGR
jgi:DNA topoisomerase-1